MARANAAFRLKEPFSIEKAWKMGFKFPWIKIKKVKKPIPSGKKGEK